MLASFVDGEIIREGGGGQRVFASTEILCY